MTTADPISLARPNGSPPMPTRSCCAPRGRPTSRPRSAPSCVSTTATRPTSSSPSRAASGWAATRSSASGPRRLLEVRDGRAHDPDPARHRPDLRARPAGRDAPTPGPARRHPRVRAAPPRRADRRHAALHRRRRRRARLRRGLHVRADRAAARSATRSASRRRPFIETDLVLVFDHLTHTLSAIASLHTERAGPRGPLPDRRGGRLRGARADGASERRELAGPDAPAPTAARASPTPIDTSLGRDEYIHAVEVAKDAIAAGEAIQVVLARRQSFDLPTDPRPAGRSTASASTARSGASTRARTCSSCGPRSSRSSAPRPELLLQAEGDKLTTHPIAGHPAARRRRRARTRSSPSSSSATRRSAPST